MSVGVTDLLDLVVDATPDLLLVVSPQGQVVRANAAWRRVLGWSPDELSDTDLGNLIHPDDLDAAMAIAEELAGGADRAAAGLRNRCRHRDGGYRWLEWNAALLPGPGLLIATARDVTETVAVEAGAAREAARLRATVAVQREITAVAGDRDAVLRLMADRILQVLTAGDSAVVRLLDGDVLRLVAGTGRLADRSLPPAPLTGSLPGLAVTTDRTLRSDDTATDPRGNRSISAAAGVRSLVVAPMVTGEGRPLGVLMVGSSEPGAFDDGDEQQLTLLAHALGGALQHAEDAARNEELLDRATSAVEKLTRSERRFVALFGNSAVANILVGLRGPQRGRIVLANPAFSELLGYPANRVIGMHLSELVDPARARDLETQLTALAAGRGRLGMRESVLRHRDGSPLTVSSNTSVIVDEDGSTRAMVQVLDITAMKQAQADLARMLGERTQALTALQVSETRFRLTFDNSPLGVTLLGLTGDDIGRYLAANPAMTRISGYRSDELVAMTFRDLVHPDDIPTDPGFFDRIVEGPIEPARAEYRYLHKDGHVVWVAVSTAAVHDDAGRPLYLVNQIEDITARRAGEAQLRAAEQALAASEQRFRAQFTNSAAGQVIRALDGTFIEVNPAYAEMVGYPVDVLIGMSDRDLLDTGDVAAGHDLVAELFAEADSFTHETRLRHAAGHWIDVEATMSLVRDAGGEPQHVIGVVIDVTDRRIAERSRDQAAEEIARRNDELEAADQLKFDIIGMLGHEIGNPLSSIRGYSELLVDDWTELDEARRDGAITAIARQAARLDEIVQEVLAMVTLDAGVMITDRRELSLRESIDTVLASTANRHVPVLGDDRRVLFSPGQLQQILVNLLSNAAKYGGGATAIRITGDADAVHVRVEDDGPGVPDEFRHRLFERLARADRDARSVRGTGLGLYIVRGLARANDGNVRHQPGPTGGSHFIIDLPRAR